MKSSKSNEIDIANPQFKTKMHLDIETICCTICKMVKEDPKQCKSCENIICTDCVKSIIKEND